MEVLTDPRPLPHMEADVLLVGVFQDSAGLDGPAAELDAETGGLIRRVLSLKDFRGRANETLFLYPEHGPARIGLVGLGPRSEWGRSAALAAYGAAARRAARLGLRRIAVAAPISHGLDDFARALAEAAVAGPFEPGGPAAGDAAFSALILAGISETHRSDTSAALEDGTIVGMALNEARGLVNAPPNQITPPALAGVAAQMARELGLECEVWDEQRLQAEEMTAVLAVARGSAQPPRLVLLRYTAPEATATLALIGKGVTFDAGGLGLKDTPEQRLMKNDMSGAAAVLGAMQIIAHRRPRLNVIGLIPSAENMPDGAALRTGDVIWTKSGRRVEILDADCEGRLLLCDTFAQAHAMGATHLIDIATLSGACARAFADVVTPVMGYDRAMVNRLIAAGQATGDLLWEMPLLPAYRKMLDTPLADLRNYGGSAAAAITAGAFLGEFAEGKPWAHLDIAATCWADKELPGRAPGATGVGVRLLAEAAARLAEEAA